MRVWGPLAAGILALVVIFRSAPGPHDLIRWLGLIIGFAGLGGVILGRHTLGASFSVAPRAKALVTRGIYSYIRNPVYLSGLVFIAGVGLMLRRVELLAVFAVVLLTQIIRARREAAVLEVKFGDVYREYRKRTWF